ncbi:MAG: holo-ACP synthase [Eubacteriales bacterium]|nr:holo-ACP synthase [Eubacteriales bacterium]MDD3882395.1 holo-ACP synthase [Eubacteriales bacterium]MDD4512384.1 holo-ACP synthase [Eubacteriales bacterium]
MIIGIGIDLCEIERIKTAMEKPRFLEKYYSDSERAYLEKRGVCAAESAAAMFAVKEAALKALGTGISEGLSIEQISVEHDESGRPSVIFTGAALERFRLLNAKNAFVTITHSGAQSAAVVVLEA